MPESRHLVLATVINIRDNQVTYPCCTQCYSKLFSDFTQDSWRCGKCDLSCNSEELEWRYRLALTITDHRSICNVCVFGRILEPIFGITATKFSRYYQQLQHTSDEAENVLQNSLEQTFIGNHYYFGFKICESKVQQNKPLELDHVVQFYRSSEERWTQDDQEWRNDSYVDAVAFQMIPAVDIAVTVSSAIRDLIKPDLPKSDHVMQEKYANPLLTLDVQDMEGSRVLQNIKNVTDRQMDSYMVHTDSCSDSKFSNSTSNFTATESFGQTTALLSCEMSNFNFSKSKSSFMEETLCDHFEDNCSKHKTNISVRTKNKHTSIDIQNKTSSKKISAKIISPKRHASTSAIRSRNSEELGLVFSPIRYTCISPVRGQNSKEVEIAISPIRHPRISPINGPGNICNERCLQNKELSSTISNCDNSLTLGSDKSFFKSAKSDVICYPRGSKMNDDPIYSREINRLLILNKNDTYNCSDRDNKVCDNSGNQIRHSVENIVSYDDEKCDGKPTNDKEDGKPTNDKEDGKPTNVKEDKIKCSVGSDSGLCTTDFDDHFELEESLTCPSSPELKKCEYSDLDKACIHGLKENFQISKEQNSGNEYGVLKCKETFFNKLGSENFSDNISNQIAVTTDMSTPNNCVSCTGVSGAQPTFGIVPRKLHEYMPESEDVEAYLNDFTSEYVHFDDNKYDHSQSDNYDMIEETKICGKNVKKSRKSENERDICNCNTMLMHHKSCKMSNNSSDDRKWPNALSNTVKGSISYNKMNGYHDNKGDHGNDNKSKAEQHTMPESEDINAYLSKSNDGFEMSWMSRTESWKMSDINQKVKNGDNIEIDQKKGKVYKELLNNCNSYDDEERTGEKDDSQIEDAEKCCIKNSEKECDNQKDKKAEESVDNEKDLDSVFDDSFNELASRISDEIIQCEKSNINSNGNSEVISKCELKNSRHDHITIRSMNFLKPSFPIKSVDYCDMSQVDSSCVMNGSVDLFGSSTVSQCSYLSKDSEFDQSDVVKVLPILNETQNLSVTSVCNSQLVENMYANNKNILNETTDIISSSSKQEGRLKCSFSAVIDGEENNEFSHRRLRRSSMKNSKAVQFARRLSTFKSIHLIDLQMKMRQNSLAVSMMPDLNKKSCLKDITSDLVNSRNKNSLISKSSEKSLNLTEDCVIVSQELFTPSPVFRSVRKENHDSADIKLRALRVSTPKDVLTPHSENSKVIVSFCGSEVLFSESFDNNMSSFNCEDEGKSDSLMKVKVSLSTSSSEKFRNKPENEFDSPALFSQSENIFPSPINMKTESVEILDKSNCSKTKDNRFEFSPDLFGADTSEILQTQFSPKAVSNLPVKRLFHDR